MHISMIFILFSFMSTVSYAQGRIANVCLSFITEESYAAECIVIANRYTQFSYQEKFPLIFNCRNFKKPEAQLTCIEQAFTSRADKERYFKSLRYSKDNVQETCRFIYIDLGPPDEYNSHYIDQCIEYATEHGVTPAEIYNCRKNFPTNYDARGSYRHQFYDTASCIERIGESGNSDHAPRTSADRRCSLSGRLTGRCE